MAKVLYHNANLVGRVLEVLKENKDGTVDIGVDKMVMVKSCHCASDPKAGHALRCLPPGEPAGTGKEPDGKKPDPKDEKK